MTTTGQYLTADDSLRYVFIERVVVQCPACNSTDLKTLRSQDQGDGTRAKRTKCMNCDHRFFVIVE